MNIAKRELVAIVHVQTVGCGPEQWIPQFSALDVLLTQEEIDQRADANETTFNTQKAAADQALLNYLRQCIAYGVCDEQQIHQLTESVKHAYEALIQEAAFLAYVKSERLAGEQQYQSYESQIDTLKSANKTTAHQAGETWFAVEQGYDDAGHALTVSQGAASSIQANQAQIDYLAGLLAALHAHLAMQ